MYINWTIEAFSSWQYMKDVLYKIDNNKVIKIFKYSIGWINCKS